VKPESQGDLARLCLKMARALDIGQDAEREEAARHVRYGLDLLEAISNSGELSPLQLQVRAELDGLAAKLRKPSS
jgi:hypothetical protein